MFRHSVNGNHVTAVVETPDFDGDKPTLLKKLGGLCSGELTVTETPYGTEISGDTDDPEFARDLLDATQELKHGRQMVVFYGVGSSAVMNFDSPSSAES